MKIIQSDHITEHVIEYRDKWYLRRYHFKTGQVAWLDFMTRMPERDPDAEALEIMFKETEKKDASSI